MVDWKSAEEINRNALAFVRVVHVSFGVYLWEWVTTLEFEGQFITGKKKYTWPMIFYFLNRYSLFFTLIGLVISQNVTVKIECQALFTFNQFFGCASIGFASINLSIRTIAVWSRKWYILYPIIALILGHWSLLMHGVLVKAEWIPDKGCSITDTNNTIIVAIYIYTMLFDLIVMFLTAIKLVSPSSTKHSRLTQLIFQDGLIYFILAFLSNLIAVVFLLLNLNPVMSIIVNIPALTLSTIVACRIIRRLSNFGSDSPEMFSSPNHGLPTLASRSFAISGVHPKVSTKGRSIDGVHVQMETFHSPPLTKAELTERGPPSNLSNSGHDASEQQVII